jgi:hypothetical protein
MSVITFGTNSLVERLDARRWSALESGGDSLSAVFQCRTTLATGYVAQLISSGHPSFPAMRTQSDAIETEDAYTGMSIISARFNGVRSATSLSYSTQVSGRINRSRPINAVQTEIEIRSLQNYVPRLSGPTAVLLEEVPIVTASYASSIKGEPITKNYTLYPVIESVEFAQLAENLFDCTYYVTVRECISSISSARWSMKTGYSLNPNFQINETVDGGNVIARTYRDNTVYFANLPTQKIRMSDLQIGNGLDKLAAIRGKSIRQKYVRITNADGEFSLLTLFDQGGAAGFQGFFPIPRGVPFMGPPRLLPEASNETGIPL